MEERYLDEEIMEAVTGLRNAVHDEKAEYAVFSDIASTSGEMWEYIATAVEQAESAVALLGEFRGALVFPCGALDLIVTHKAAYLRRDKKWCGVWARAGFTPLQALRHHYTQ